MTCSLRARRQPSSPASVLSRTLRTTLGAAIALFGCQCALADTVEYQGHAVDPGSGRVLYRETHLVQRDNGRNVTRVVLYQCADGITFARKRVDYANSMTAPDFEMVDGRDGYREGLRRVNGKAVLFARDSSSAAERTATIAAGNALVVDAGFDEFVTRNWATLASGKTLALDFAIPSKGTTYTFKLAKQAQTVINGTPAIVFRMNLSGLLSLFAPHIDVSYGTANHDLLRFEGVTNIHSGSGRQMVARIDFPATAPTAITAAAMQDALTQPLKACSIGQ